MSLVGNPDPVECQWVRDEDGVWSHMQFDAEVGNHPPTQEDRDAR